MDPLVGNGFVLYTVPARTGADISHNDFQYYIYGNEQWNPWYRPVFIEQVNKSGSLETERKKPKVSDITYVPLQ
ncbi:MAG: hypothetical protein QF876_08495 [Desulfobacterales bacterium]|jgi:hypothetical protein|nr:hypothetical protein [Desulfobacterales bacterium]MDP6806674.1 hypothetical protein [Desulfobacterales bacterium]|tara:strand:+ start:40 stop:261 length:222 start_codon:yes stop_codon:yes gene_type:complete